LPDWDGSSENATGIFVGEKIGNATGIVATVQWFGQIYMFNRDLMRI
jgi:hypothetical protein